MKSFRLQISIILILIFYVNVFRSEAQMTDFSQLIINRFNSQLVNQFQEKAYLQTDKPYYSAGEDIWFKGYVVNATSHIPINLSKFLYVELIDMSNEVISRVKIKKDSCGFAGTIKLKPDLLAGNYVLRAYTYWMQNATADFFFKKNIYIGNSIDDNIKCKVKYVPDAAGKISALISFTDASQNPISGKEIDMFQNWNNPKNKRTTYLTNKDGKISVELSPDTTKFNAKVIELSINDPRFKFKNKFLVPESSSDFDVQFFPESGNLLANTQQVIAFKAIGKDGLAIDVEGKVYSSSNEEIIDIKSKNKGMGRFSIETLPGENYYVKLKSNNGVEKRFNLPMVQPMGVAIHLIKNKNKILYQVINKTSNPDNSLYLLAHSRGKVYFTHSLNHLEGQIEESLLPAGIVSFSVVDSLSSSYCERLYFVRGRNLPKVKMNSDKTVYGKREPINLDMNISSMLGKTGKGNFSVSVTDNYSVRLDSLSDNILSYLLLSSDIKGYIEDPASYFTNNLVLDHENLDLLMLTQGWKRFNTADIIKEKYKKATYYLEVGQALSGKVLNIFNKPPRKCGVIMLSPYNSMTRLTQTDSLGRYLIDGIDFPDSTAFVLKAKKSSTFGDVEIIPDIDEFPKSSVFIPQKHVDDSKVIADYLQQSKEKYYLDGGMRVINLQEVTVKAKKTIKDSDMHFYSGMEDTSIDAEILNKNPGKTLLSLLGMMPGIQVMGEQIFIRGSRSNPYILIDDIPISDISELSFLNTEDIENILLFKGGASASIFGANGGNGVIAINIKKGVTRNVKTPISLANITPLGFQKPSQFYVPKYDVDSVRLSTKNDLRTTIYWNPRLMSDSVGNIHVNFYSADKASDYSIVLEGITDDGEICKYLGTLKWLY